MMTQSLRTLLTGIVDYAGLYPPAAYDMARACESYNRARVGERSWMLGRFICPVSRLDEFAKHAASLMPGTHARSGYREHTFAQEPWHVSAVLDQPLHPALEAIASFNIRHEQAGEGLALVDCVEMKVGGAGEIDAVLEDMPDNLFPFIEFPVGTVGSEKDCRGCIAALSGEHAAAKIRTGGVTAGAFPTPEEVLTFINACAAAEVPFKATAGLHHPLRGSYPLTYEPGCASGTMYGYLNVFLAAAFVFIKGANDQQALALLMEDDPRAFTWCDDVVSWRGHGLESGQLAAAREQFALSFGSCSFDEPSGEIDAAAGPVGRMP